MERLKKDIERRIATLDRAIKLADRDARKLPKGVLRISSSGRQKRYFVAENKSAREHKYIPAREMGLVKGLAQKDYAEKMMKEAIKEREYWFKVLSDIECHNADLAFERLSDTRKALTSPYILSDEKYAMLWQAQTFQGNGFNAENKRFPSQRGELMRSKSEVIIASILDELEIPYHYEKPLKLGDGKTRYPDFTLLDIRNRCEVYLEHLGMLDNDQYWFNACRKIKEYIRNGIFPGVNLLITYEASAEPLNIAATRTMLKLFRDRCLGYS